VTTLRRRIAVPVLLLLATLLASLTIACGSDDPDQMVVTGLVTNVVSSSVTALSELELTDADGVAWQFKARGFVGMTPSHLTEHGATGSEINVEYFEENGQLVISSITDD